MSDRTNAGTLHYDGIEAQLMFLKGKVLTVIDAVLVEDKQCSATKDLIHQQFREQLDWIHQLAFGTSSRGAVEQSS
jgi:hypothetical protein